MGSLLFAIREILLAKDKRLWQMIGLGARGVGEKSFEMRYGFFEGIEGFVMADEWRCVFKILGNTCALLGAVLQDKIAAS